MDNTSSCRILAREVDTESTSLSTRPHALAIGIVSEHTGLANSKTRRYSCTVAHSYIVIYRITKGTIETMAGRLYLVATPIGHLGDISDRMREVLGSVDLIAAEDTRRTGMLLKRLDIKSRQTSYHDHNERRKYPELLAALESGQDVAVVSNAGTPGIADPGWHIVQAAIDHGIDIIAVPGPTAFVSALQLSGLPIDRFAFEGYLPRRPGRRRQRLQELQNEPRTMIFYETPHRLESTLSAMQDAFGERRASLSRELTKVHETTIRGSLQELLHQVREQKPRGEYVVVVAGALQRSSATDTPVTSNTGKPDPHFIQ